jgi:hypothetical protein
VRRRQHRIWRWGPYSGVIFCLLWAPMAIVIPRLPDLGSPSLIEDFHRSEGGLLKVVILLVSVGFFFFPYFFAALTNRSDAPKGPDP